MIKGNTFAVQIITTRTVINNNTVLENIGIPSVLLNAQPAVGDRFYSMIDYIEVSTNKHQYIFALLEVTAVGSSNTQPFSVKVIGKQAIHYSHALGYRKHVKMSSIAGAIQFSYFSLVRGFPTGDPTTLASQIRSMSMGRLEASGTWLVNGEMCFIHGVQVASSGTVLTLYGFKYSASPGATLTETSVSATISNFEGWVEPVSYLMNA